MKANPETASSSADRSEPAWALEYHQAVPSTQDLARLRPAWSAVLAAEQTAGRGQAERGFVSNLGGLYLSAVLPYAGDAFKARGFALAVGWSLFVALRRAGVRSVRLRWPNDLMVGSRKIGGILVEQGGPDTLLVGVGINVENRPWAAEPALAATSGRLADAMVDGGAPALRPLADRVLRAIRAAHAAFATRQLAGFVPHVNRCWGPSREVVIEPAGGAQPAAVRGWFCGLDPDGKVRLRTAAGGVVTVPAHQIERLREVA